MRVLLVEDDPRLGTVLKEGLAEESLIVDHVADAASARSFADLYPYDLVILDVGLPEGPDAGFRLAREWRSSGNATPILFLTALGDIDSKVTGLTSGGDDYLTKPFDFRELRARVMALVRRAGGLADNVVKLPTGAVLDVTSHEVRLAGKVVPLTGREYALLECFALNPGRTFSRAGLLDRLWATDRSVDAKIVDVYVGSVRRKLGDAIIETIRGAGYRLGRGLS
ncbi:response regulator transcription factor [Deinococcus yavapaiensis]|uniref:Two-component system response regulator QseB n=1 Tax=Deinococcus yavapaiensis KR-236 TaxID=694435 RepID=A0A318S9T4_9DEIO|nr:response regulator transcription factor [Deinococcus yavapaiensis]PYE53250.1 two-component system response regulator QseB [Deinococcus yavapaiensis KR-236]